MTRLQKAIEAMANGRLAKERGTVPALREAVLQFERAGHAFYIEAELQPWGEKEALLEQAELAYRECCVAAEYAANVIGRMRDVPKPH